jgi:hypothetical protein
MSSCVVVAASFYAGRSAVHSLIATVSISIRTSSRKSPLTSTSVLAGGFRVDIFVADCAYGGDLADVAQEVGQLDDIPPRGIGGLEGARQVLEDLVRLGSEVALPDEVTFSVERNLPRDVNHPAGRRIDDMAVADGAGQGFRREEASFVHARVDTTSYAGNTKTSEGRTEHETQTATSGA